MRSDMLPGVIVVHRYFVVFIREFYHAESYFATVSSPATIPANFLAHQLVRRKPAPVAWLCFILKHSLTFNPP